MNLTILKPRKALNKAYLKVKTNRKDIESFKIFRSLDFLVFQRLLLCFSF